MCQTQYNFTVKRYVEAYFDVWNGFIEASDNATFLFHRNYMEYHADRFVDFSLLVFEVDVLIAVLPAHVANNTLYSHQGLTYGGVFVKKGTTAMALDMVFKKIVAFAQKKSITTMVIKQMPIFYNAVQDNVWKFLFEKYRVQSICQQKVLSVDYANFSLHKTKLKHYKKALKAGLYIKQDTKFSLFWERVLIPRLRQKHNAKPVHTLQEIEYLHKLFPQQIFQFNAYLHDEILAGITIFDKGAVVKSQYGATTDLGEKLFAMDFLFVHLIEHYKTIGKQYFSMGTVTEKNALGYNPGLLRQKIELGCTEYPFHYFQIHIDG